MTQTVFVCTSLDLDWAARTLWGECRGEIPEGQIAVAWVIRTRAEWSPPQWWGVGLRGVCTAKDQFSCWTQETIPQGDDPEVMRLREVAERVMDGLEPNPAVIDGQPATHYHVLGSPAEWAAKATAEGHKSVVIGKHEFFALGPGG